MQNNAIRVLTGRPTVRPLLLFLLRRLLLEAVLQDRARELADERVGLHRTLLQLPHAVDHFTGLGDVEAVHARSHVNLHVLDHAAHVGDVRELVFVLERLLHLTRERAVERQVAEFRALDLHGEQDRRGESVVRLLHAWFVELLHFEHVDGIPRAVLDEALVYHVLLDQETRGKARIQIPHVHGRDAALVVQFSVRVKDLVGLDLEFPQVLGRVKPFVVLHGRVVLVGPWRAMRIAVAIVVTEQILAAVEWVDGHLQRLIHALVELVRERRRQTREVVHVLLHVARRHAPHEVQTRREACVRIAHLHVALLSRTMTTG